MASEEVFPGDNDHDDDGALDNDEVFRQFFGIVLNMETEQPDREADERFLREMLPKLRAEGRTKHAASLITDFVRKHGAPMEFDS